MSRGVKGLRNTQAPPTATQQFWQGNVNQGEGFAKAFFSTDEVRARSRQLALALFPGSSKDWLRLRQRWFWRWWALRGCLGNPPRFIALCLSGPHSHSPRDVEVKHQATITLIFPCVWSLSCPKRFGRATAGKESAPLNLITPFLLQLISK